MTKQEATLKRLRKYHQLTQRAMAEKMGVSLRAVESWETGKRNPTGSAEKLLSIYQEHPELLQKDEEEPTTEVDKEKTPK